MHINVGHQQQSHAHSMDVHMDKQDVMLHVLKLVLQTVQPQPP